MSEMVWLKCYLYDATCMSLTCMMDRWGWSGWSTVRQFSPSSAISLPVAWRLSSRRCLPSAGRLAVCASRRKTAPPAEHWNTESSDIEKQDTQRLLIILISHWLGQRLIVDCFRILNLCLFFVKLFVIVNFNIVKLPVFAEPTLTFAIHIYFIIIIIVSVIIIF